MLERLDPLLASHGFHPHASKALGRKSDWFGRTWVRHAARADRSWIDVSVGVDPHDIPFFVGVGLGEGGSRSFLDRELRQVALWQFVEAQTGNGPGYGFDRATDIGPVIDRIADDLSRYAADFLSGDPTTYRRLRGRLPPSPRAQVALSVVGQLLLMPWRLLLWVARGGPRRLREQERAMRDELDDGPDGAPRASG